MIDDLEEMQRKADEQEERAKQDARLMPRAEDAIRRLIELKRLEEQSNEERRRLLPLHEYRDMVRSRRATESDDPRSLRKRLSSFGILLLSVFGAAAFLVALTSAARDPSIKFTDPITAAVIGGICVLSAALIGWLKDRNVDGGKDRRAQLVADAQVELINVLSITGELRIADIYQLLPYERYVVSMALRELLAQQILQVQFGGIVRLRPLQLTAGSA